MKMGFGEIENVSRRILLVINTIAAIFFMQFRSRSGGIGGIVTLSLDEFAFTFNIGRPYKNVSFFQRDRYLSTISHISRTLKLRIAVGKCNMKPNLGKLCIDPHQHPFSFNGTEFTPFFARVLKGYEGFIFTLPPNIY